MKKKTSMVQAAGQVLKYLSPVSKEQAKEILAFAMKCVDQQAPEEPTPAAPGSANV